MRHVGLLPVAGEAHVVEDLALELDAAAAAKRERTARRQRRGRSARSMRIMAWLSAPMTPSRLRQVPDFLTS